MNYEKVIIHKDDRGCVFEPVGLNELAESKNVHVVLSAPGAVRANHYHKKASEVMVITGSSLVRVRENGEIREIEVPAGEAYRFYFSAGVTHAVKNIGNTDTMLVAFSTEIHNPDEADVIVDKLI